MALFRAATSAVRLGQLAATEAWMVASVRPPTDRPLKEFDVVSIYQWRATWPDADPETPIRYHRVVPREFLKWYQGRGDGIPGELRGLLDSAALVEQPHKAKTETPPTSESIGGPTLTGGAGVEALTNEGGSWQKIDRKRYDELIAAPHIDLVVDATRDKAQVFHAGRKAKKHIPAGPLDALIYYVEHKGAFFAATERLIRSLTDRAARKTFERARRAADPNNKRKIFSKRPVRKGPHEYAFCPPEDFRFAIIRKPS